MAMTLRLTEEQERALAMLAEAEGVSKHEAALRAIADAAAEVAARLSGWTRPDVAPPRNPVEFRFNV